MTLKVYNSLTRELEVFEPLNPPYVGIYVCGPTVYGDAHIGHAKSYIAFDVIVRYLRFLDYKVRYVQNITDVGHLTDDADQGEDKVERKARLEQVHPMQIAETYTQRYFEDMDAVGVRRPDISPRASGHIPEQIEMVQKILDNGHAYVADGNVYFDVMSWKKYGTLSKRRIEEAESGTRTEVRTDKRHPADFALWKKAEEGHILRWKSPWSVGYPGWHIECSAMSMAYIGETLDIHGGGLENQFPHHEDEIAQSEAATGKPFCKYWMHNNMVTVGGQKMGKSLGNFVTLRDVYKRYDPLVLRFVILQGHYRRPFDYSDESLEAGRTGYDRLVGAVKAVRKAAADAPEGEASAEVTELVERIESKFRTAMDDDFNTAGAVAALFDLAPEANRLARDASATRGSFEAVDDVFRRLGGEVLGIVRDAYPEAGGEKGLDDELVRMLIDLRTEARENKDFGLADRIRDRLGELGVVLEDSPEGTIWRFE